jgi:hypothetical protein
MGPRESPARTRQERQGPRATQPLTMLANFELALFTFFKKIKNFSTHEFLRHLY